MFCCSYNMPYNFLNKIYSFDFIFINRTHELLNLPNKGVRITKLTNCLKQTSDEERGSELSINEEDSVLTSKPFQTYCKQTSLHGWKYVAFSKGSKFERLCWLFLLLLALLIASNLVYRWAHHGGNWLLFVWNAIV